MEANYRDPACSEEFFERNGRKTVYISGEKWLLMQAVTGYALFTGEPADTEAMVQAISRRYLIFNINYYGTQQGNAHRKCRERP